MEMFKEEAQGYRLVYYETRPRYGADNCSLAKICFNLIQVHQVVKSRTFSFVSTR
jgi:hypothetical protein